MKNAISWFEIPTTQLDATGGALVYLDASPSLDAGLKHAVAQARTARLPTRARGQFQANLSHASLPAAAAAQLTSAPQPMSSSDRPTGQSFSVARLVRS